MSFPLTNLCRQLQRTFAAKYEEMIRLLYNKENIK